MTILVNFARRYASHVVDLNVHKRLLPSDLLRILQVLPNLERLSMDTRSLSDDLSKWLTITYENWAEGDGANLPRLKHICVDNWTWHHWSKNTLGTLFGATDGFVTMLSSRSLLPIGTSRSLIKFEILEGIELYLPWDLNASCKKNLDKLRRTGVNVTTRLDELVRPRYVFLCQPLNVDPSQTKCSKRLEAKGIMNLVSEG
jgi:hypothetical protein